MSYSCPFLFLSLSVCSGQDPGTVCGCRQLQTFPSFLFRLASREGWCALRRLRSWGGALRVELVCSLGSMTFHLVFASTHGSAV